MNLLDIRKKFVELSGRYDLMDPDSFADTGADFMIQGGQRFLDRLVEIPDKEVILTDSIPEGDWTVILSRPARAITRVEASTDDGHHTLKKVTYRALREFYSEDFNEILSSYPSYWALYPGDAASSIKTLAVLPAGESAYTLNVTGFFYSAALESNNDESFWSLEYPEILLKSALWQLEVFHRNTEGANDWLRAIQSEITSLEMDGVFNTYGHINEMEG